MVLYSRFRLVHLWTAVTVIGCLAVVLSNSVYFDGGPTSRFLLEKGSLSHLPWWLAAFYFHVVGASACLVSGLPLMFPGWTRKNPKWHRYLGYVYLNSVLWMAAPSGLVLALHAKGGLLVTLGFGLAGIAWWQTTWSGYWAIRRRDVAAHIRAMIRSYCWALSAPAFRAIQIVLYSAGIEDSTNYLLSLWLSIAASVWLAESCLASDGQGAHALSRVSPSRFGVLS